MSPDLLPSIAELRRIAQSLAVLDAILCPDWEYRYYSFNSRWGFGDEMASMRNGSGDEWFPLGPSGYSEWADEYYEVCVDRPAVSMTFAHQPLTEALVRSLNPEADPLFAFGEAEEVGYARAASLPK